MKGDPKVLEYLNKAVRSELTAINQYRLHALLQADWGYSRLAAKSKAEVAEESLHADTLIDRIIFLEGEPDLQTLDPLRIGKTVKETLENDLAGEHDARALYLEGREVCSKAGDIVSMKLFEQLLADEEGHIDFLETQLELLESLGASGYGQLNADPADVGEA